MSDKATRVLLALREGVRSWPNKVRGILSDIPRQTVEYQIKKLEEDGTIKGYIPIVKTEAFGHAYLIHLSIDPTEYEFSNDAHLKVEVLRKFFNEAVDHAPVSFYVFQDNERKMIANFVTVTSNPEGFIKRLCTLHNISQDDVIVVKLDLIEGIPNYSKHSVLQSGQEVVES